MRKMRHVSFRHILFLLLISAWGTIFSQTLSLKIINTDSVKIFKYIKYNSTVKSQKEIYIILNSVINSLREQGYLLASVDSMNKDSVNKLAYLSIGNKFIWAKLKKGNAESVVLSKLGYSEKIYAGKSFSYKQTARLLDKTISYYENNGYPFATIQLDSVIAGENNISARLKIEKNKFIKIDSILVEGDAKINKTFLYRYLNIKPNMSYNELAFREISKKIKQLSFLSEKRGQELRFYEKQNKLYLFLNKKNASQFDGIIGILPDNKGKTVFTGDIKIKLVNNILRAGETFDLNWRRLQTQTQDFKARIIYPFILGSPIGADYNIKIYKKDTSFIDVNNNIGLQYYFKGLNNLKVFYKQRNSNILSTNGLAFTTVLPEYADINTSSYGLALAFEKSDYRFNPHKGFLINLSIQTGNKTIRKNPKINDAVYQNIQLKSTQYQTEGDVHAFIQLKGHSVLHLAAQYGSVFGDAPVFKNELFRIGGLKTLRGFDEESIYSSTFVIPTIEYRYLFAQNSNILIFAEGAWYENINAVPFVEDMPYSIGAGINFDTKAGIFSLNYALGSQQGNPIDFRAGKIHFGLTALF